MKRNVEDRTKEGEEEGEVVPVREDESVEFEWVHYITWICEGLSVLREMERDVIEVDMELKLFRFWFRQQTNGPQSNGKDR